MFCSKYDCVDPHVKISELQYFQYALFRLQAIRILREAAVLASPPTWRPGVGGRPYSRSHLLILQHLSLHFDTSLLN